MDAKIKNEEELLYEAKKLEKASADKQKDILDSKQDELNDWLKKKKKLPSNSDDTSKTEDSVSGKLVHQKCKK